MILLFFLKRQLSIKKKRKNLKKIRYFSLLELLIVLSIIFSVFLIGGRRFYLRNSTEYKLKQSTDQLKSYLDQVYSIAIYAGTDVFIEIKKTSKGEVIVKTDFIKMLPKKLKTHFKKELYLQHLDSVNLETSLKEPVVWIFNGLIGKSLEKVLVLSFKENIQYLSISEFPIKIISNYE